mgnify:FL=1
MKKYQDLQFIDDFMFCKVMTTNPEICKRILNMILGKKVKKIVIQGAQQAINITAGSKGIRMDVYLEDEAETVYDLEMQTSVKPYLSKRLRYYHAMIDLNHLEKGMDYGDLPHTIIIFICTFDYFGKRLPIYSFENRCIQLPELIMGDETEKIFVNPDSDREGLSIDFNAFLDYLNGKINEDNLVGEIEREVEKARMHKEWEVEYMTWQAFEMDARREGRAEGIIKSGRRHLFSDAVIIEDIMAETGCNYADAKKALEDYDR